MIKLELREKYVACILLSLVRTALETKESVMRKEYNDIADEITRQYRNS